VARIFRSFFSLAANVEYWHSCRIRSDKLSSHTKANTGTKASCPSGNGNGCIVFVNNQLFFFKIIKQIFKMKKFRTSYGTKIQEVEILRETEKQVVILTDRNTEVKEAKRSDWQNWHNSKEEAKQFLLKSYDKQITDVNNKLEQLVNDRNSIAAL